MRLTREQAAIIGAYTGITCGPFSDVHEYAERVMGRPIWAHEFATQEVMDALCERARPEFLALCAEGGAEREPSESGR